MISKTTHREIYFMISDSLYYTIEKVIQYIEENLKRTITLDQISTHVSMSKFHLNRMFHVISRTTLMRYVKIRKLSSSLNELLNTNLKISAISQEYGFDYEQSYIRSFENTFGISPDRFRKEKKILRIKDKINLDYIKAMGENSVFIEAPIVVIPEFFIVGVKLKICDENDRLFHEANIRGNEFYNSRRHEIKNALQSDIYIGLVEYIIGDENSAYYIPSLQVSKPDDIPLDMICHQVPTNKYGVFKYIGLHHASHTNTSNLLATLNYIYEEWLPKTGYLQSAPYHFERINEKVSRDDYCEIEIYIPVSNII
jgi:AraC family transcriptional regulator